MSYLAPIRLYIFISFVTFFLLFVIPEHEKSVEVSVTDNKIKEKTEVRFKKQLKIIELEKKGLLSKKESDTLQKFIVEGKKKHDESETLNFGNKSYKNVKELDSIQKIAKPEDKLNPIRFWLERKAQIVNDKYTAEEINERFIESFIHNLPKALFFYMPLFAFVLWVFQDKKRWYYFDHGIFTLHYFSFLLLVLLIINLVEYLLSFLPKIFATIDIIFKIIAIIYMIYYFFPAHYRFYQEKKWISITKAIVMFIINIILISLILVCFAIYTFINLQ